MEAEELDGDAEIHPTGPTIVDAEPEQISPSHQERTLRKQTRILFSISEMHGRTLREVTNNCFLSLRDSGKHTERRNK